MSPCALCIVLRSPVPLLSGRGSGGEGNPSGLFSEPTLPPPPTPGAGGPPLPRGAGGRARGRGCAHRDTSSSARGREAWPGEPSRCPSTVGKPRARLLLPDGDRGHAPAAKGVDGDRRDGRRFPPPSSPPPARAASRAPVVGRLSGEAPRGLTQPADAALPISAKKLLKAPEMQPRRSRDAAPPTSAKTLLPRRERHVACTSAAPRQHLGHTSATSPSPTVLAGAPPARRARHGDDGLHVRGDDGQPVQAAAARHDVRLRDAGAFPRGSRAGRRHRPSRVTDE